MLQSSADGVLQISEPKPLQSSTPDTQNEPDIALPINIVIAESPTFRKVTKADSSPTLRDKKTSIEIAIQSIDQMSLEKFDALEGFGIKSEQSNKSSSKVRKVLSPTVIQ